MIMEGKIYRKNCLGRKNSECIDQIVKDVGCGRNAERKALAKNRDVHRAVSDKSKDC